jgi:HD superfamily phosphodiesterase
VIKFGTNAKMKCSIANQLSVAIAAFVLVSAAPVQTGDNPKQKPWRAEIATFALENFKNPAWGYSHSQRDYALAIAMAKTDNVAVDDDVLYAAAYLHDMAAFPKWAKEGVDHADRAAELVETILAGTGFPEAKIDAVRAAIRTHMYFREPQSPEARYLHDADALDWLGAVGIARVMALADANGGKPMGPDVVKMLDQNLADVPSRVVTPAGRSLMPARRDTLAAYLRELRAQSNDLEAL